MGWCKRGAPSVLLPCLCSAQLHRDAFVGGAVSASGLQKGLDKPDMGTAVYCCTDFDVAVFGIAGIFPGESGKQCICCYSCLRWDFTAVCGDRWEYG